MATENILKVLMMGGQRVGKSSMLAGLIESMLKGQVRELLEVENITSQDDINRKLAKSIETLKYNLIHSQGKTFIVDDNKSSTFDDYLFQFRIPNTNSVMQIMFTDANGEFYDLGKMHDQEIREKVQSYDVFVVAVDTPFLMEAANSNNRLCTEAVNLMYNHVADIHSFFTEIDDKEGQDAKLVIFVPLKCEKWVKEDRVDEINQRIMQVYAATIDALKAYANIEIDIIPIQTVGNIVFQEHTKALVCKQDGKTKRCTILRNNEPPKVRFEDGTEVPLDPQNQFFMDDAEAIIKAGSKLVRPNSWFRIVRNKYEPHNCEQLAFYILQFYLAKVLYAKRNEENRSNRSLLRTFAAMVGGILGGPFVAIAIYLTFGYLLKKFGTITIEQMENLINKLNEMGYIKKNTDGIVTIKESTLYITNE